MQLLLELDPLRNAGRGDLAPFLQEGMLLRAAFRKKEFVWMTVSPGLKRPQFAR
jgi:hypothetical protein